MANKFSANEDSANEAATKESLVSTFKGGQFLKPNYEIDHCTAFSQLSMFFAPNSIPAIFPVFVLAYHPMFIVFVGCLQ